MRRGLMAWDANEIPIAVLNERIERLQRAMAAAGQDALILYTNFIRSAAVSYLTAFSPYWADGVLLVPRHGSPVLATTLSKRVSSWIQSVKPIGELVNSPTPGTVLGKRLASSGARRVAVLELDAFPSGLYEEMSAALPGVEIVDGSESFAAARAVLDDIERNLIEKADKIAQVALDRLSVDKATSIGTAVGAVERHARLQGAEEVYVAIAANLDADRRMLRLSGNQPLGRRFAIRATIAYKGAWVRHTKTYVRDSKDQLAVTRADAWFKALVRAIDPARVPGEQIVAAIASLPSAKLSGWMAEAPVGTRPLAAVASANTPGKFPNCVPALVVTLGLTIDGVPWCGAGVCTSAEKRA